MSKAVLERLTSELGDRILETSSHRGDDEAVVAPEHWLEVAKLLKHDDELAMNHFIDITAVDYPEREPDEPRFDVLLFVRSIEKKHRVRIKTRVAEGQKLDSLCGVWAGANWGEREVYDMFGIELEGHPDMRRILMYPEFVGYPLRKDYPIDRAQPLVPYREVEDITKLPPFGVEEGQPWGRIDWQERLEGREMHTSPAIAYQSNERRMLSDSDAYNYLLEKIDRKAKEQEPDETGNESKE